MLTSVIVATRNRPNKIYACLKSILANNFSNYELIVVDQSDNEELKARIGRFGLKVRYFKIRSKGLSRARNFGVGKSRGEIVAFTDDDCIVDKKWLRTINNSFVRNKEIAGIFGKVLPYRPKENQGKFCPCTFKRAKRKKIDKMAVHWKEIGFGNNMSFRKSTFEELGEFESMLGVGSIGRSAEDAEFAQRVLNNNKVILYEPDIKVYHNRWLSPRESFKQQQDYKIGEMACYSSLVFFNLWVGKKVVLDNLVDSSHKLKYLVKSFLFLKFNLRDAKTILIDTGSKVWGLVLGLLIYLKRVFVHRGKI